MGRSRGVYKEEFPAGTTVRVVERPRLEDFVRTWKLHNPLQPEQLAFAGVVARVASVAFYHGSDELYSLEGVSGIWHEVCLGIALSNREHPLQVSGDIIYTSPSGRKPP